MQITHLFLLETHHEKLTHEETHHVIEKPIGFNIKEKKGMFCTNLERRNSPYHRTVPLPGGTERSEIMRSQENLTYFPDPLDIEVNLPWTVRIVPQKHGKRVFQKNRVGVPFSDCLLSGVEIRRNLKKIDGPHIPGKVGFKDPKENFFR